ncbi:hypothetical protein TNCV_845381 [Trichonephila clavipes]|uniref:Uncharacterized protein n=1 Tax=Trichonephila clavipes TaxID=2585209 RepID=A0A8X7BKT6_TRICX|nr:hypothetical protein TNCV_845381 [Trichonephila clavipes]
MEEHVIHEEVLTGLVTRISDMIYLSKEWAEEVRSNKVVSKNADPNIDRESLLRCTWLWTMEVLQSSYMDVMLINVLLFRLFFSASFPHILQLRHLRDPELNS